MITSCKTSINPKFVSNIIGNLQCLFYCTHNTRYCVFAVVPQTCNSSNKIKLSGVLIFYRYCKRIPNELNYASTTAIELEHSCSVHPWNTDSILEFWKMIAHLTVLHDIFVSDNPKLWEKIKRKFGSRQKKIGFGWGFPITWQGWTVLLSYIVLILIGSKSVAGSASEVGFFIVYVVFLTAVLIFIYWKKGEKIGWRWGNKK